MEQQLLDSAVMYERLKPTFYNLQNAYGYRGEEIKNLREALRLSDLQIEVQRKKFEKQLSDSKKPSRWWKGFRFGFGTGLVVGTLAGSSI